jgi:hypothetical protein
MKKIILFTCLLGITAITAMAQMPKFTFGIKGGVNYSNLKTKNDLTGEKNIMGYQAGSGIDLGNLTFDVRYESGLSNVSQSKKYSQQQNLFHLSLGFKLL